MRIPPMSPPSGPAQWLLQGPPAEGEFLAENDPFQSFYRTGE
jgi:hypothetical protein